MIKKLKNIFSKFNSLSAPVKASIAFVICSFFQRGISVLTTPIFTRLLTTRQYGYYSVFNSWLEIISVFTTLKLAGGVFTQALVKYDKRREELTASTAGLGTMLTLLFIIIYLPFSKYINKILGLNTVIMMCIFLASWATLMFELWASLQRVEYRYKALVGLTILTSVAKPLFGVVAVICTSKYKAEARIVSLVAVELISYSWLFLIFIKRGKNLFNKFFWKYSLSLNVPLIPHYLTRTVLNQCDRLMIKVMVDYSSAGIYSLAYNLAWMLTLVTSSLLNTFNPWMYQRIKKKEIDKIGPMCYSLLLVIAILCFVFIAIAPELISIFAPVEYYEAVWVIPPVTASVYFLFMYSIYANFEFYYEKTKYMTFASTLGGILNIILNYVFIKKFGYLVAGYTTLICYIFYTFAHYYFMKKIIKDKLSNTIVYDMKIIIGISMIFLLSCGAVMLTYNLIVFRYLFIILISYLIYRKKDHILNILKQIKAR